MDGVVGDEDRGELVEPCFGDKDDVWSFAVADELELGYFRAVERSSVCVETSEGDDVDGCVSVCEGGVCLQLSMLSGR